jgi:hypothetical protein
MMMMMTTTTIKTMIMPTTTTTTGEPMRAADKSYGKEEGNAPSNASNAHDDDDTDDNEDNEDDDDDNRGKRNASGDASLNNGEEGGDAPGDASNAHDKQIVPCRWAKTDEYVYRLFAYITSNVANFPSGTVFTHTTANVTKLAEARKNNQDYGHVRVTGRNTKKTRQI